MSDFIEIIWAETHNLKNISLSIPKNKLVVITGLSWSWKSSLAFETLYAEWQRRYLESLSTYARMIISSTTDATKVQEIRWLSPTIAINQKTVSNNPRSTVGTITEIYDFYRLLFTNIWIPFCINHPDQKLVKSTIQNIYSDIIKYQEGTKFFIAFPLKNIIDYKSDLSIQEIRDSIVDNGFVRFLLNDTLFSVADDFSGINEVQSINNVFVIIDRLIVKNGDSFFETRLRDSLLLASEKSKITIRIIFPDLNKIFDYSLKNACPHCDYISPDLTLSHFSFNSHYGACEECGGLWYRTTFEEKDVINFNLTLNEWAILPWENSKYYGSILKALCKTYNIPMDISYNKLSSKQRDIILYGVEEKIPVIFDSNSDFYVSWVEYPTRYEWIIPRLERHYIEAEWKTQTYMRNLLKFATEKECRTCGGFRLKKPSLHVKVWGKNIGEVVSMNINDALIFWNNIILTHEEKSITESALKNIIERLEFLQWVGLSYITLARRANTLSGWESQRIRLATQIWTRLEWIIYVLDEPSIGLHPRDNDMLIQNLKKLSNLWNTVVVVEHDEDIMRESDFIVDIGPWAWVHGGSIVFSWTYEEIIKDNKNTTWLFLSGKEIIKRNNPKKEKVKKFISIYWAEENNLKNINVRFPLGCMTVVTGVSWSGKSSLVMDILANSAHNFFNKTYNSVWKHKKIEWFENVQKVIIIDQSPIGKTPHSNIATYTGVFTYIREVFASSLDAKARGFNVGRFSFNTKGGRCEICEWAGTKKVEMHFLPDVYVECETCGWSRYNADTLSIKFKWKNIAEVLNMTIEEASVFFSAFPRIKRILDVLIDVGLWYITLWQSAPTLSWWESQRIKLAFDLSKRSTGNTLYILDEPTTGLHFADVQRLLDILDALVEKWNTVVIIEHNLDIIANADAIIDIWPEWGDKGGSVLFSWPREKLLDIQESYTAQALKKYLKNKKQI